MGVGVDNKEAADLVVKDFGRPCSIVCLFFKNIFLYKTQTKSAVFLFVKFQL